MKFFILLLSLAPSLCLASQEEDRNSGTCAMYLFVANKMNLTGGNINPKDALDLADNPKRAAKYSEMYANKIKESSQKKTSIDPLIKDGVNSCYKIGIKLTN